MLSKPLNKYSTVVHNYCPVLDWDLLLSSFQIIRTGSGLTRTWVRWLWASGGRGCLAPLNWCPVSHMHRYYSTLHNIAWHCSSILNIYRALTLTTGCTDWLWGPQTCCRWEAQSWRTASPPSRARRSRPSPPRRSSSSASLSCNCQGKHHHWH